MNYFAEKIERDGNKAENSSRRFGIKLTLVGVLMGLVGGFALSFLLP